MSYNIYDTSITSPNLTVLFHFIVWKDAPGIRCFGYKQKYVTHIKRLIKPPEYLKLFVVIFDRSQIIIVLWFELIARRCQETMNNEIIEYQNINDIADINFPSIYVSKSLFMK